MLNMQVQGKRRREGYCQEDVKHASARKENKGRIPPRRCQTCKCREREEGEDTTKKMLNMQVEGKRRRGGYHQEDVKHVQGKRRREGYHQEDVKHASAGKEKKGEDTAKKMLNMQVQVKENKRRIPPRRC